ncbi:MAG: isoprenylcysteine carboxylmethyltransferase family protein [Woeseiaceae bacterium]
MLTYFFMLALAITPVALLFARFEYRRRGNLSALGLSLVLAMFLAPNLILEYATTYEMPSTPLDYVGVLVGATGVLLCLVSMFVFRSPLKVLCLDAGTLAMKGPYRWSRNPQYVGWFMFLLGFALNDWSWWCLVALVIVATYLHLLILIEEEHLNRVFGEQYARYRRNVSRYCGRPHPQS